MTNLAHQPIKLNEGRLSITMAMVHTYVHECVYVWLGDVTTITMSRASIWDLVVRDEMQ